MNEVLTTIFGCLPTILLMIVMAYGISLFGKLLPKNRWLVVPTRKVFRFMFIEPFRKSFQRIRWLVRTSISANPNYRIHQFYFENYPVSPLELYTLIEEVILARQIVGVELSRVTRLEWHLLSPRRIYLLIRFRDAVCFIGGVRLGTGLLVSRRYSAAPGTILRLLFQLPFAGVLIEKIVSPATFHRTDIYYALEQAIRGSVLEATDRLAQRGIRQLMGNEQRPLLTEFYE